MAPSSFVFFDARGKRWNRVRLAAVLTGVLGFVALVVFVRSLLIVPKLRRMDASSYWRSEFHAAARAQELVPVSPKPPAWLRDKRAPDTGKPPVFRRQSTSDERVFLAFYAPWDAASFRSLESHYQHVTHVAPEWFSMRSFEEPLVVSPDSRVVEFASSAGVKLLPVLSNLDGKDPQPEIVEELARHPERREVFIRKLIEELQSIDAAGVVVDWEELDPGCRVQITSLLADLADRLHEAGLELWLCIPCRGDIAVFDLDALSGIVDRFVALILDENGEENPPGPIASLPWWSEWFDALTQHGAPEQWIVGIGSYGYEWYQGGNGAMLSFPDVMARARLAEARLVGAQAPLYQPHFDYEKAGVPHSVWFLDAVTFRNQYVRAHRKGVGGTALFRLGTEDEAIWKIVGNPRLLPEQLERIESPEEVISNVGRGDLLTVSNERAPGQRFITAPNEGGWEVRYAAFPQYPLVSHEGGLADDRVVLSFDDGPDPAWTPMILDILKAENVPAVFFVVGRRAIENPELVRRIVKEGHEIGNHTYSHPDLAGATEQRTVFELNATQRIIEGIAGVSTILFRPPYHAEPYPRSWEEFMTFVRAQAVGYMPVTESVDTEDWDDATPEQILARVKERRPEGNIILLHDGGGDRSATVAALPRIIDYLRTRGDRIVSLAALLDVRREVFMPPIATDDSVWSRIVAQTGLAVVEKIEEFAWAFTVGVTLLFFARSAVVMLLASRHRRRGGRNPRGTSPPPPVSVVMAAYNESKVIAATIRSVLDSDYVGPMELVVVDDGSTDDTARIVAELAAQDPRIRLLSQRNQGKARALNRALSAARYEIIVTLDADTQFRPETIRRLVEGLDEPGVGAVCGHIRVGNRTSFVTRCQALEYMCGFNLDRRAYDYWNAITVAPGAASAFRKSAIEKAGGIVADTLAEDTDLTLGLHQSGYSVRYIPRAIAYTEAPETVRSLLRQRVRWAFGTLQCVWKHRDLLCNLEHPGLGFFSLPSVWICQLCFVALVPVTDLILLLSLVSGAGIEVVEYLVLFLALEWVLALFACHVEGEPLVTSWRVLPMRVLYRPLLCAAVWSAIVRALRGAWYGWDKVDRKGSVRLPVGEIGLTAKEVA